MLEPVSVLLVGFDQGVEHFASILHREESKIRVTDSLEEALDVLESETPDAVVLSREAATDPSVLDAKEKYRDLPILVEAEGRKETAELLERDFVDDVVDTCSDDLPLLLQNSVSQLVEKSALRREAFAATRDNELLLRINRTLVRETDRNEMELSIAQVLSEEEPYDFAWIGRLVNGELESSASAGKEPDPPRPPAPDPQEPAATPENRAATCGSLETVDTLEDGPSETWREWASRAGFLSAAAIPLRYRDQTFGVLALYSGRPEAFDGEEKRLLNAVGRDVGQAIDAVESSQQLRELKERYRTLLEAAPDAVILADPETGELLEVNRAATDLLGMERERLLDLNQVDIHPTGEEERYRRLFERHREESPVSIDCMEDGGWVYVEGADGEKTPVEINAAESVIDGRPVFLGVFRDITHRVRREESLRQLYEAGNEMVKASDEREVAEIGVSVAKNILGQKLSGIWYYDQSTESLEPVADTSEAEDLLGPQPRIEKGEGLAWEVYCRGEPEYFDDLSEEDGLLNPDTPLESEMVVPLGKYGILIVAFPPSTDVDGPTKTLTKLLGSNVEDALSLHENMEMNRELMVLNRVTRHDIRNDMNLVFAWSQELMERAEGEMREQLREIKDTSYHVVELTQNTKELIEIIGTGGDIELKPVDLSEILEESVDISQSHFRDAQFTMAEEASGTEVLAGDLLSTVFRNLLNNAVQHNDKKRPQIRVSVEEGESTVATSVADNGPGIPEAHRDDIFGKGEKGVESEGTGIGLYLVRTIVEDYGGEVHVEENEPEGAIFTVKLKKA